MESVTANAEKEKKSSPAQDRVTLAKTESEKLENLIAQVNDFSKGFLTLTKSEMINFLIRAYKDTLTAKDFAHIRLEHYDPLKHITWIMPQIKEALSNSDTARVLELQEELRKVELSVGQRPLKEPRVDSAEESSRRRKRKPKNESVQEETKVAAKSDENFDAHRSP